MSAQLLEFGLHVVLMSLVSACDFCNLLALTRWLTDLPSSAATETQIAQSKITKLTWISWIVKVDSALLTQHTSILISNVHTIDACIMHTAGAFLRKVYPPTSVKYQRKDIYGYTCYWPVKQTLALPMLLHTTYRGLLWSINLSAGVHYRTSHLGRELLFFNLTNFCVDRALVSQ